MHVRALDVRDGKKSLQVPGTNARVEKRPVDDPAKTMYVRNNYVHALRSGVRVFSRSVQVRDMTVRVIPFSVHVFFPNVHVFAWNVHVFWESRHV